MAENLDVRGGQQIFLSFANQLVCLFVEAWSLTEPGVHPFGKSGWPEGLGIHLSSYPPDLSSQS